MKKKTNEENRQLIYQLDGRPSLHIALPLGLQHVLTMFVGNLAPVLIMAGSVSVSTGDAVVTPIQKIMMVQCTMFVSGLATLLQLYPIKVKGLQIGGGLPIVMGTGFVFVPTLIAAGTHYGLNAVFGAIIIGSVAEMLFGIFLRPLKKFFPPVVIGCVLMTIGLNLLPVGVQYLAGGAAAQSAADKASALLAAGEAVPADVAAAAANYGHWHNLLVGALVFATIVCVQRFCKGFIKASAILFGIIVGYVAAICLGMVDFTPLLDAKIVSPPIPFFIKPEFNVSAIISIALIYVISGLETMGNVNGITVAAFNRSATANETSGAILADGIGCAFAGVFNALPNTAFGQNAGIVAMTKVVNKFCVATGAIVLLLAGFFPKIGTIFSIMPQSVLGGAVITVFGIIMINGMKLIYLDGLDDKNILIIAITFGIGYAVSKTATLVHVLPKPLAFIFDDTTVAVCIIAVLANLFFHAGEMTKKAIKASGNDTDEVAELDNK
ncbi:MAG: purine permease [Clostridiales Family XIII bacterium]|jgi:NCS2 family nucleobase:cation symporter-2|nr:purine permease [Clostridiales Family XIII bacterium]